MPPLPRRAMPTQTVNPNRSVLKLLPTRNLVTVKRKIIDVILFKEDLLCGRKYGDDFISEKYKGVLTWGKWQLRALVSTG